jgi:predicted PurR-regulated permease PerM
VSGFVTGNLAASVLAGAITAGVLFLAGIAYPVPVGVLVAFLDMLPIFGAFVAIAIVAAISFSHSVLTGVIVTGVVFAYHQVEVYYLRPVIYGRMVELSPLAVLIAATVGTEVAGPLGAVAAIPVGGTVQLVVAEALDARRCYRARCEEDEKEREAEAGVGDAPRAVAVSDA